MAIGNRCARGMNRNILGLILFLTASSPAVAWPKEMAIHILWDARVKDVKCHALRHEGHDYSLGGSATLVGRSGELGRAQAVAADIVVSRLEDPGAAEADAAFLCQQLTELQRTGKSADILFSVVKSNMDHPRKAIRAITKLRGCDENDRTGSAD